MQKIYIHRNDRVMRALALLVDRDDRSDVQSFRKKTADAAVEKTKEAVKEAKEAAEKAKCELSSVVETTISLPYITADANGPKHLELSLTRAKFEDLSRDLLERCKKPVEQALSDAKLGISAE